jgi:methionyl-tRNA formyltransferase
VVLRFDYLRHLLIPLLELISLCLRFRCLDFQDISGSNPFDVGVVVSFGRLLPECAIDMFPQGAVNIHPSLLPRYRGSSPIQHAIMNNDIETGVCLMALSRGVFDQGAILARKSMLMPEVEKSNTVSLTRSCPNYELVIL